MISNNGSTNQLKTILKKGKGIKVVKFKFDIIDLISKVCSCLKNVANIKFKLYIKSFTCKLINHTKKGQVSDR